MRMFERSTELPFMLSELRYISLMTDISIVISSTHSYSIQLD